jgi:hypothetical protein
MWRRIFWYKFTDVLKEHTASILRVKEEGKQVILAACLLLVSHLAYFSTPKMEAVYFSETMQHYILKDSTLKDGICLE